MKIVSGYRQVCTFSELEFIGDILETVETSVVDPYTFFESGSADPKFLFMEPDPNLGGQLIKDPDFTLDFFWGL
jgi:hypothetical protein